MQEITNEIVFGLGGLLLKVFVIVIPLIMFLEWAGAQRWFARFVNASAPIFRPFGFKPTALLSLLTGLVFGISYGAGVLIPQARSGELDPRQVYLIALFLGLCHALVEDTLLFVAVGATGWILVLTRILAAVIVVFTVSKLSWPVAETPIREAA